MSILNEIKTRVRNEIHDGGRDINTIKCTGYKNVEHLDRGRKRRVKVAKWILENQASSVGGNMTHLLGDLVAFGYLSEIKGNQNFVRKQSHEAVNQVLAEFDHLVP